MTTRAIQAAVAAAILLGSLVSVTTAVARTVEISPSGRVQGTSVGRISFSEEGELSFECGMTLAGTVASRAIGELLRLDPRTNALIGRLSAGAGRECTNFARITLLFPAGSWQKYKTSKNGERTIGYILHAEVKVEIPFVVECLYDLLLDMEYNETNGRLTITRVAFILRVVGAICPRPIIINGQIVLNPAPRIRLRDV
jgi:hypothetical protein